MGKRITRRHGTIANLERLLNSGNGNPTWLVVLTDGSEYQTRQDGAVGYVITWSMEGKDVALQIEDGRIIDLTIKD